MAFRRGFRRASRSSFRSKPRSRGTHVVTKPRRWSVCQLHTVQSFQQPNTPNALTVRMIHLASIEMALNNTSSTSTEQRVGGVLQAIERKLEIGGIVFDYGLVPTGTVDAEWVLEGNEVHSAMHLVTDRLVLSSGSSGVLPAALPSWNPFVATFPMGTLQASTPTLDSREATQPTRIHWQKHDLIELGPRNIINDLEGVLYVPNEQKVRTRSGTVNRRLKLRLDDEQGLFLCLSLLNPNSFVMQPSSLTFQWWFRGLLYYRYSQ